jgi:non-homologous end joining protein Ku
MPIDDALMLNTLRYSDEILPHEKFAPKAAPARRCPRREMTLALRLIDEMSEQWDPRVQRHLS